MGKLTSKLRHPIGKLGKRTLGIVLSVALLASAIAIAGSIPSGAVLNVTPATNSPPVYFYAPETIYVDPTTSKTQWFANSYATGAAGATWGSVTANGRGENANGYIHFYCNGATDIVLSIDSAPAGYAESLPGPTGASNNFNHTLSAGVTATNEGLVRWKATYKVGGINYTSYCYSYIYVPDTRAISGSTTHIYDGSDSGNGAYSRGDVGMFIIGAHYNTQPTGGSYSAGTTKTPTTTSSMQNRLWAGWPSGLAERWVSGSGGTATANLLSSGSGIAYASVDDGTSDSTYTNRIGSTTGGLSYLSVDTSRYSDLNQIPQIRAVMVIARARTWWGSNGNGTVVQGKDNASGWTWDTGMYGLSNCGTPNGSYVENMGSTANPGVNSLPAVGVGSGVYTNSAEIYRGKLASAPISDGANATATVFGSYHWHWESSGVTWGRGACIHQNGARIQGQPLNKGNLRSELQAQIQSGVQYDGMRGEAAYRATIETMATALCKPDYAFGATAATDLGAATNSNSMAGQVRIAAANLEPKNGQAEAQYRNAVTGGLIPIYAAGNNITYEIGESVTAQYDAAMDIPPGYVYPPVAVNVPYTNGSGVVTTDTAAPGVTPGTNNPATGLFWSFGAGGLAPDSTSAPNKNVKAARLNWVWWLAPITYTLRLLPGDGLPAGAFYDIQVTYGQDIVLPTVATAGFSGAGGATFVDWKFDNGALAGGRYLPAASGIKNLTAIEGATIMATAQWIGGTGSKFNFNFGQAAGTEITSIGSATGGDPMGPVATGLVEFTAPSGSTVAALGTWPTGTRTGYRFNGWFFDPGTWIQPLASYAAADVATTTRIVYAQWIPWQYNISYGANTATGTPPLAHTGVDWDSNVVLLPPDDLTKQGYDFVGWSKAPAVPAGPNPLSGKVYGTDYFLPGDTVTNLLPAAPTANGSSITLYAMWQAKTPEVNFYPNWHNLTPADGTPPTAAIATQTKYYGGTYDEDINVLTRAINTGVFPADPVRFGWTFGGWYTVANPAGTGVKIEDISQLNQAFQASDHNLYAFWINGSTVPVTVTLDPGATDATLATLATPNTTLGITRGQGTELLLTDLAGYQPTRPGYTFNGWAIDNPANAVYNPSLNATYTAGDTGILLNNDTTLTAQWVETAYTVRYNANYVADAPSADNPDPSPDPVPAYVDGGLLKITTPNTETAATLTRTGYTLLGYAYQPTAAAVDFTATTPTVAAMLTGTGNSDDNDSANPVILNVYALWQVKGGDTGGDGDDDTDDDTGDDGVILLRYTVPADVTLVPATPTFKYLTYDQPYGTLATAVKPGNFNFIGWKVIQCGGSDFTTPLLGEMISSDTIVKHEYTIWVEPVFEPFTPPPPPTCWQRIQACLTTTRNRIIKFFFPLLALGLPILNYGIPNLTVEMVFELPFHTLFLACLFGLVVFPIFLIVPSWFTVIHELAPSWWPNVKRFYLL